MKAPLVLGCLTFLPFLLTGCSGNSDVDRAEVHGSVSLDGEPVREGIINFVPVEGTTGPSAGGEIKDGKYAINKKGGPVIGKNRVELKTFRSTGKKMIDPTAPKGTMRDEVVQAFPPEYSSNSKEVREITKGSNEINFDVHTKAASK